jgi:hypothetical protein
MHWSGEERDRMSAIGAARRTHRRWILTLLAPRALLGPGLAAGCDAGEPPTAPMTSGVSPTEPNSSAPPGEPGVPRAGESGGGEASPPLEAALDPSAPIAAARADAGASESTARGDAGANEAAAGDAGPPPTNDCCTTSATAGCNDATVAACVCAGDPFCCSAEYDDSCVTNAISRCALDCDDRAPTSDCCTPSDVPGCTLPDVQACICDIDPACCVLRFDQNCINIGTSQCGSACGAADGGT